MRESQVEKYLRKQVELRGGLCLKWVSPGNDGVPDRIVLFPQRGKVAFVELKAPGKTQQPLQLYWQGRLIAFGHECLVIDSFEGVNEWIDRCERRGYF